MRCISYKKGYKYQLVETCKIATDIKPEREVAIDGYILLATDGRMTINNGYAWDGPSGPTIDTPSFMRGSLVHDAFYQLMRAGLLSQNEHRKATDRLLTKMCRKDGMNWIRAGWVYWGLRWMGHRAADSASRKRVLQAPKSCRQNAAR